MITQHPQYGSLPDAPCADMVIVADDLLAEVLSYQAKTVRIGIRDIDKALRNVKPHLIICESAGNCGVWGSRLKAARLANDHLRELVETSRLLGVPSVFWFTCSPKDVPKYTATARLFDVVVVSSAHLVNAVSLALGKDDVYLGPVGELEVTLSQFAEQRVGVGAREDFSDPTYSKAKPATLEALKLLLSRQQAGTAPKGNYISYLHATDVDGLTVAAAYALTQTVRPAAIMLSDATAAMLGSVVLKHALASVGTLYVEGTLQAECAPAPAAVTFCQGVVYERTYAEEILACLKETRASVVGATDWRSTSVLDAQVQPLEYEENRRILATALGTTDLKWLKSVFSFHAEPFELSDRVAYPVSQSGYIEVDLSSVRPAVKRP